MTEPETKYVFGPFRLDVSENLLLRDSEPIPLTSKSFEVLKVLLERNGHLVEKQDLLNEIWPNAFVEEAILSVNIAAIRRALGDEQHQYIETVPKRGYRFVGEVQKIGSAIEETQSAIGTGSNAPDVESISATSTVKANKQIQRWVVLALAILVVGLSAQLARRRFVSKVGNSVAVLPLRSLSTDPEQQHFADAMTDLLLTDLGRIGKLKVVSRQSVLQYQETQKTVPEIARELKVDYIVEGTVLRSGQQVRITAQLIHAPTDHHLWAESYDRDLGDTLALQEEVAEAIAQEVGVKIVPATIPQAPHVAPAAYESYLRGLYFLDEGKTDDAITEFHKAIAADPNYAASYTKIASAYFGRAFFGSMPPKEAFPNMKEAALHAIELDETSAEAHAWLAIEKLQYEWDWAGADREFRRSLELNPNDSDVRHMYAHYLLTVGRWQESLSQMDQAFENDPIGLDVAT